MRVVHHFRGGSSEKKEKKKNRLRSPPFPAIRMEGKKEEKRQKPGLGERKKSLSFPGLVEKRKSLLHPLLNLARRPSVKDTRLFSVSNVDNEEKKGGGA